MKLTVITGPKGELVGFANVHLSEHNARPTYSNNGPHATITPMPGQTFHEIVAPQGHEKLSRAELRRWVLGNMPGKK